jgi:hypothetical protein
MKESVLKEVLILRTAVGYLMEEKKWWYSNFFEPTSADFLAYIFPKSIKKQSNFYLEAIRHSVDAEVGANYYHLFRLPVQGEEKLYRKVRLGLNETVSSSESAFDALKKLAGGLLVDQHQGPINIGSSEQLNEDVIQVIAAHYLSAFENNYKVHPYLN